MFGENKFKNDDDVIYRCGNCGYESKEIFSKCPECGFEGIREIKNDIVDEEKKSFGKKGVIKIVVKEHKTEEEEESKDFTESISKGGYAAEESIEEPLEKEKRAIKIDAKESKKNYLKLQIKT